MRGHTCTVMRLLVHATRVSFIHRMHDCKLDRKSARDAAEGDSEAQVVKRPFKENRTEERGRYDLRHNFGFNAARTQHARKPVCSADERTPSQQERLLMGSLCLDVQCRGLRVSESESRTEV